jgi:hypothetical protein
MIRFLYLIVLLIFFSINNSYSEIKIIHKNYDIDHKNRELIFTIHNLNPRVGGLFIFDTKNNNLKFEKYFENQIVFDFKQIGNNYSYAKETGTKNLCGTNNHNIILLDSNFNEIDNLSTLNLNHTNKHDFLFLENGNYLLNAYHGIRGNIGYNYNSNNKCWVESVVQEINPDTDEIKFEWHSIGEIPLYSSFYDYEKRFEYAHLNSMYDDNNNDLFIFSLRGTSEIVFVDKFTAKIVNRIGGKANQYKFINDPLNGFCGQHSVSKFEDLLIFYDNGDIPFCFNKRVKKVSRGVIYKINHNNKTLTLLKSFSKKNYYAPFAGSFIKTKYNTYLLSWGSFDKKDDKPLFTEFDKNGKIINEFFINYYQNNQILENPVSYRAYYK